MTFTEFWPKRMVAFGAFLSGTISGVLPCLGSTTAGFLSYSINKRAARDPEAFGTEDARGIAASETANNAAVGANLNRLLTLGIPGNIAAALLVSAFIIHGIQPGPLPFQQQAQLVDGMICAMIVSAPGTQIYPAALLLCFAGSFAITGATFGVSVMLASSISGYLMRALCYSIVAFIVALLLT